MPRRCALGLDAPAIQAGCARFPARAPHGAGRPQGQCAVRPTIPRRPTRDPAAQALACFNDIFWIAGGKPKTGGIIPLAEYFPRIRKAYLIGEAAADFARTLDGKVAYEMASTLDRAVAASARDAERAGVQEPVVLLSPACASFDQYPNFEVRGTAFRDLVLALPGIKPVSTRS